MIRVLTLGKRLAGVVLFGFEVGSWRTGQGVKRNFDVLAVSDLVLLDV